MTADERRRLQIPAVWTWSASHRSYDLLTLRSLHLRDLATDDSTPSWVTSNDDWLGRLVTPESDQGSPMLEPIKSILQ